MALTQGPISKVNANIAKIHVWAINNSSLPCWILLSMTQGCVMTLTQGHIFKFKVTVQTNPISVSWLYITPHCHVGSCNISHNCCPWLKDVSWSSTMIIPPRSRSQYTQQKIISGPPFKGNYIGLGWYFNVFVDPVSCWGSICHIKTFLDFLDNMHDLDICCRTFIWVIRSMSFFPVANIYCFRFL